MKRGEELDKLYLRMAHIWAENSYAVRRKVGCLIVKDRMIISDGYNGTPEGFDNICEDVIGCKQNLNNEDWNPKRKCCKIIIPSKGAPIKKVFNCYQHPECKWAITKTKPYVLHAEANAITKLAKSSQSSIGATLYCTDEPCIECSKLIIQAGISRVVYHNEYHSHEGVELLKESHIVVDRVENLD